MSKEFKTVSSYDDNTIMIVDALNLAFRYKHSGAIHFLEDYLSTVESLRRSYKAKYVVIACDEGSSTYRKQLHAGYKAARKNKFEKETEEEKAATELFFEEFTRLIETIDEDGKYALFKFPGCEADDIAAYIVNKYKKSHTIWLMSSDKDWDLLVDIGVSRFSYVSRKEITIDNWSEHYEYDPEDHISIKCLAGDTGDSIPGVQGIGPKKALALVKKYGTAYDIIASLPIESKYAHIKKLNEFGAEALMNNYRLMDLVTFCSDALGEENCNTIDSVLEGYLSC